MISRAGEILRTGWFSFVIVVSAIVLGSIAIPFGLLFAVLGDRDRHATHAMATLWARLVIAAQFWWRVDVQGRENLARRGEGVVYVANHQHEIDILLSFKLRTRFRWYSKRSLFFVPFLGWSMWVAGYVGVIRGSHQSHAAAKAKSLSYLARGVPMLLFPEGTLRRGKELSFKTGAFRIAQEAGVPIIPITIEGTGDIFRKRWALPGTARVRVHPRIDTEGRTAAELCEQARQVMSASLRGERRATADDLQPSTR